MTMLALLNAHRRRRDAGERGFTLIEVMVAIVLLGIVAAALVPLLVGALRASNSAKLNTQAKNLVQAQIERMRNLPYHVAQSAGPYLDLLDIYFHDLASGTDSKCGTGNGSYASATSTYTCVSPVGLSQAGFTITVASQFLDKDRNVVAPPAGYDSQSNAGLDVPPSATIGMTVTAQWTVGGVSKNFSSYTQISNAPTGLPQTVAQVRDDAIAIASALDDTSVPVLAKFEGGIVNEDTSLSTGATANAQVQGALTSLSSGTTSSGQAAGALLAPPDQNSFTTVNGAGSNGAPCLSLFVACFGASMVSNLTGKASNGLPQVATSAAPASAALVKAGSAGTRGFWFSNVPVGSVQNKLTALMVQDSSNPPTSANPTQLVRSVQGASNNGYNVVCGAAGSATTAADFLTSTGNVQTVGGASHSVTSCATTTTRRVDIMPTSFAPNGVVQVTLNWANLSCTTTGAAASISSLYNATVSYWSQAASGYVNLTVSNGQASDPLTAALLTRSAASGGVQVGSNNGNPLWLGDYISSWSSGALTGGSQAGGTIAQGALSVVNLSTQPTRDADSTGASGINLTAGQLSCLAEDNR
jgi:prepilin-type N-terminal cleavage/methylation domain-containing protein